MSLDPLDEIKKKTEFNEMRARDAEARLRIIQTEIEIIKLRTELEILKEEGAS